MARRIRDAVAMMTNREDARVIEVALFRENVERPFGSVSDRKARRTVADDRPTARHFEGDARAPEIVTKLARRQVVDELVMVAVRGDFVSGRGDLPDQLRKAIGDPSQ